MPEPEPRRDIQSIRAVQQQISDQIAASGERCITANTSIVQATELIAITRQVIARSKDVLSRGASESSEPQSPDL
jgi:hypothetical protein